MSFFREYSQVSKLLKQKQQVVVYAESRHYYQYYEKIISDLLENDISVCYLTSDNSDPVLKEIKKNFTCIHVKWMLGFLFSKIMADVLIMTMTDLGNYLYKRSGDVGCYVYMFHAAVSTHQQYNKNAFRNYDAVFCIGEFQEKEFRMVEKLFSFREKELIAYGYPLIDTIRQKSNTGAETRTDKLNVLVAPSWFDGCIFETCIDELLKQLSVLPYNIILRSHPEYEKRKARNFRKINKQVEEYANITLDTIPDVMKRLQATDILITDRSGIAFEYAFGTGRPVLFLETELKINNPDYLKIGIVPVENSIRNQIGLLLSPSDLDQLGHKINELINSASEFNLRIAKLGNELFYNSEASYKRGLDYIKTKINRD